MDSLYFEPLDLSVTILTAPTGWSGAAELCAIREASTNYYILEFKIEVFQDPRTLIKVLIKGMG